MSTDDLTEHIARVLNDEGWTFEGIHEPGGYDECEDCRLTVAPIAARIAGEIAAEVRAAKAEAWDEGHSWGWSDAQDAHDVRQVMDRADWPLNTPNPYRQETDR